MASISRISTWIVGSVAVAACAAIAGPIAGAQAQEPVTYGPEVYVEASLSDPANLGPMCRTNTNCGTDAVPSSSQTGQQGPYPDLPPCSCSTGTTVVTGSQTTNGSTTSTSGSVTHTSGSGSTSSGTGNVVTGTSTSRSTTTTNGSTGPTIPDGALPGASPADPNLPTSGSTGGATAGSGTSSGSTTVTGGSTTGSGTSSSSTTVTGGSTDGSGATSSTHTTVVGGSTGGGGTTSSTSTTVTGTGTAGGGTTTNTVTGTGTSGGTGDTSVSGGSTDGTTTSNNSVTGTGTSGGATTTTTTTTTGTSSTGSTTTTTGSGTDTTTPTAEPVRQMPKELTASEGIRTFIKKWESDLQKSGKPALHPYSLGDNACTVGWGHATPGGPCTGNEPDITVAQAQALFDADIKQAEKDVRHYVKVPLSQNEFDAMVDYALNRGGPQFGSSTVVDDINDENYGAVYKHILGSGTSNPDLAKGVNARRLAEATIWKTGEFTYGEPAKK